MKKIYVAGVAVLMVIVFAYAAYNKLSTYDAFVYQIQTSAILSGTGSIFAWLVPGIEIITVSLLVYPRTLQIGLKTSFILMLLFTAYIGVLNFYFNSKCNCGGIISSFTWQQHLVFNLSLTLLCGYAIYIGDKSKMKG